MLEPMPALIRIDDYKIEQILRGVECNNKPSNESGGKRSLHWKELVHFAACHCVNDVLTSTSGKSLAETLEKANNRWWTNRHYKFHSNEHFLQVRHTVNAHLLSFLTHHVASKPIMLFEPSTIHIEELGMELAQNLHVVATLDDHIQGEYIVQKFIVDETPESLELYKHMTTAFGMSAFKRLPERIEALSLISGKRYMWRPDMESWKQSLDYMRLVKSLLPASSKRADGTSGLKLIM
ncbi:hypothetical protein I6N90_12930 [Paenibacillus sp. GSMTC-2017]|uniref:hypothetical protein n=1 Tax=Paenibacillus sp. GSMTC-2017 TaxID=2794350 RepID=UPI001A35A87D|nr:hypothetical protein [Paenibacillus sp. GSMTC-2017]MBH5318703.1 hypothetical protein [Paenibacillus sp. GSMTC-2017]